MEPIKQVVLERIYDASPEKVWQAWTDAALIKQWWGPDNVSIPEAEVDARVGGKIWIVMEAGEAMGPYKGTLWPMLGTFTVVEPEAQLSFEAKAWTGKEPNAETTIEQTTEISFAEESGKTKLTVTATIHRTGPGAEMAVQGMQAGFTQQLEKLTGFLASHK